MEEENLANSYKEQGNKEFKAGNYVEAIEHYTRAIEKKKDKIYFTNRANCFFQMKKFKKSISDCEEALKLDKGYAKAYFRKADAYIALGELDKAFDTISKAIENKPQDEDIKNKLQEVKVLQSYKSDFDKAIEKDDYETCLRKIECLLDKCQHYREIIVKKIEFTAYLGKIDDALALVKKYQQEYSSFSDFTWVQGLVYLYRGNTEHGINIWKEGNTNDQDFPLFRDSVKRWKTASNLKEEGTELFKAGKLEEALVKYREAAEVDTFNRNFNSTVLMNIGTCLMKQSKLKEAIKEFNRSIEYNPSYAKAYLKRSNCHELLENYVAAEQDMRQAQSNDSTLHLDADIKQLAAKAKKQSKKDYYKVLGVERDATEIDIKKAFKKKTLEFHPDRHADKSEEDKAEAELKFKEVNEAYSVLTDPKKKQQFDMGAYDPSGGAGSDFGSHFQGFGGGVDISDLLFNMGGGGGGNPFVNMFTSGGGGRRGGRGQSSPFGGFHFH